MEEQEACIKKNSHETMQSVLKHKLHLSKVRKIKKKRGNKTFHAKLPESSATLITSNRTLTSLLLFTTANGTSNQLNS